MQLWIITSRAFRYGDYFPRLEETFVAQTEEEAKRIFSRECHNQGDWFWDGGTYKQKSVDENTYVLTNKEAVCVVSLRVCELEES